MKVIITAGLTVALLGISHGAFASVMDSFSITPSIVTTGDSPTETLTLQVTPDSGYFNASFSGGTVTLSSGIGPSQTFAIATGTNSESFTATFSYVGSGNFTPSFSFAANYTEQYQQYGYLYSYYVSQGYEKSCGIFCNSYWVDTSYWQPVYGYQTYTANYLGSGSGSGDLQVNDPSGFAAAAPEPSTWAMMILGFASVGFMAYRRRNEDAMLRVA